MAIIRMAIIRMNMIIIHVVIYSFGIVPIVVTGVLAFSNIPTIPDEIKSESNISFWCFISFVFLAITICIIVLIIHICYEISEKCCKKTNRTTFVENNTNIPNQPSSALPSPLPSPPPPPPSESVSSVENNNQILPV